MRRESIRYCSRTYASFDLMVVEVATESAPWSMVEIDLQFSADELVDAGAMLSANTSLTGAVSFPVRPHEAELPLHCESHASPAAVTRHIDLLKSQASSFRPSIPCPAVSTHIANAQHWMCMVEADINPELRQSFCKAFRRTECQHFPAPGIQSQRAVVTAIVVISPVFFLP